MKIRHICENTMDIDIDQDNYDRDKEVKISLLEDYKVFKCEQCDLKFDSDTNMKQHRQNFHYVNNLELKSMECNKCEEVFKDGEHLSDTKVLIKCCYAPNGDMTPLDSESENYSDIFFKTVFDDRYDIDFDVTLMVVDYNVAPDHNKDTLGYFHVNNPNTRLFMERMKSLNMLTDVFRQEHPDLRNFTFSKKQARNYTKARLDYFLISDDSLDLVTKVGIGGETTLSDHCPIYLHLTLSRVKKGRGFWWLNNDFLSEPDFIFGMNNVIEGVINQYANNEVTSSSPDQGPAPRPLLISNVLLHDVLLLESRSYTLKYAASQKERMLKKLKDLNRKIDKKADSIEVEDIEIDNCLKQKVQDLEDEREMAIARKKFVQMQIEGERPTRFFCKMNKKYLAKAQFEELHVEEVDENGKEAVKILKEQKSIEWEVRKYYYNLYSEQEARVNKEEILQNIEAVTKIDLEDVNKLDCEITEGEVSVTLKNMKNNVAPEPGGLGGVFYKTFWKYLKWVVVGSIREIYDNRELPLSQRLGIIALIPKSDKDQRFIKTGHLSLCLKLSTN